MPKSEPAVVTEDSSRRVLENGAKLVGETIVPGASLLLDGEVPSGVAHAAAGWGARLWLGSFGPIGVLLVAANSYSKSVSDRYLFEHLAGTAQTAIEKVPSSSPSASS
jgi:uncharacterized protein DUF6072